MIDLGEFSYYIKILKGDPIEIQVARFKWRGPHERIALWDIYKQLPKDSSDYDIQKVVNRLLKNRKYFRKCNVCSDINHISLMNWDVDVCITCMPDTGIVN
jgi:hypothetical protein